MATARRRRRIIIIIVIGLALVALISVILFKRRELPISVQTEKATRRNLIETVVANGRI
jgi:multidrug efflux pump subunit AcrA (membrane-fusion protein)